jgi:hypothetical protein
MVNQTNLPRFVLSTKPKFHRFFPTPPGTGYALLFLMFSMSSLFASLIWGAIGMGYFVFGKKQQSWASMLGGVCIIGGSYWFAGSALVMSLLGLGVMTAVYLAMKRGQ